MIQNAFTSIRPRGKDMPSKAPVVGNRSRAPVEGNVHLTLDRNGRRTVDLAPRTGSIVIENQAKSRASTERNEAIKRVAI